MKKLAALAGAGALVLALAGPALASWVYVDKNTAVVNQSVVAVADTSGRQNNAADVNFGGGVGVNGSGNRSMTTGSASALAGGLVVANTHVGCSTCGGSAPIFVSEDTAVVGQGVEADAYTNGDQSNIAEVTHGGGVGVDGSGNRSMTTGPARSGSFGITVVNTHWGY